MKKLDYLRKVFAQTKGKTFENYIINQIWAKVEDLGLYPVTQQYVKRPNGYALIDLYFPQIQFAIEVDEFAHEKNILPDKMRMEDIFSSISEISIERIKEADYENVKNQIENVVKKIKQRVNETGELTWEEGWNEEEYNEKLSLIKKRGKLLVSDLIGFKRIQVTNDIFNMGYSEGFLQYGKSFLRKSENEFVWFPHLTPQKDWENTISDDWTIIYEKYIGEPNKYKENDGSLDKELLRYTFAKYKDALGETSYRFIGVFKNQDYINGIRTYKRFYTEIIL
jgi:very-short-patch-repair endonuclease